MLFSSELLPIYLNDHLAGATTGVEIARRAAKANEGTELGEFLEYLAGALEAHRAQLEDVMARLDVGRDQVKVGVGWMAEKVGRLKLNGRLFDYSPLSRVVELESLMVGSQGREALWRALAIAAPEDKRIADIDFVALLEEVERHLEALKEHHARAIETMLATG
jgi:hypothetical protein